MRVESQGTREPGRPPHEYSARPPVPADLDAVVDLIAACEEADEGNAAITSGDGRIEREHQEYERRVN